MMQVYPLIVPLIDWESYTSFAKKVLNRGITDSADEANIPLKSFGAFLASLGELENANSNAKTVLRESKWLTGHLSFSFLLITTKEIANLLLTRIHSKLAFVIGPTMINDISMLIVSGSLDQWKDAIINMKSPFEIRTFANIVMAFFEKNTLADVFFDYEKVSVGDGTYRLTHRK